MQSFGQTTHLAWRFLWQLLAFCPQKGTLLPQFISVLVVCLYSMQKKKQLKEELPAYLAEVANLDRNFDQLKWWPLNFPTGQQQQKRSLYSPIFCSCWVFSLLKASFGEQLDESIPDLHWSIYNASIQQSIANCQPSLQTLTSRRKRSRLPLQHAASQLLTEKTRLSTVRGVVSNGYIATVPVCLKPKTSTRPFPRARALSSTPLATKSTVSSK